MQSLRQVGIGIIIAVVSVILVIGGILLSVAESLPPPPTQTPVPPALPFEFPTPTATTTLSVSLETPTETQTASPSPTSLVLQPTVCIPPSGWILILPGAGDTIYSLAQRYRISADALSGANCLQTADLPAGIGIYVPFVPTVTVVPCGPPPGWVRTHVVQRGDNLFRIALSYGITYPVLQRGNCMGSSTTIYAGQRLWVPNVPTRTPVPGTTTIPDFPTSTGTSLPTGTTVPPTSTQPPTATNVPPATPSNTPQPSPMPSPTPFPSITNTP